MARAAKGGQLGVNGEFYEGGRFLPRNPHRPRQDCSGQKSKPIKIQIERGVWVEVPSRHFRPLGEMIVGADFDHATNMFELFGEDHPCWKHYDRERIANFVHLYNAGERIVFVP